MQDDLDAIDDGSVNSDSIEDDVYRSVDAFSSSDDDYDETIEVRSGYVIETEASCRAMSGLPQDAESIARGTVAPQDEDRQRLLSYDSDFGKRTVSQENQYMKRMTTTGNWRAFAKASSGDDG